MAPICSPIWQDLAETLWWWPSAWQSLCCEAQPRVVKSVELWKSKGFLGTQHWLMVGLKEWSLPFHTLTFKALKVDLLPDHALPPILIWGWHVSSLLTESETWSGWSVGLGVDGPFFIPANWSFFFGWWRISFVYARWLFSQTTEVYRITMSWLALPYHALSIGKDPHQINIEFTKSYPLQKEIRTWGASDACLLWEPFLRVNLAQSRRQSKTLGFLGPFRPGTAVGYWWNLCKRWCALVYTDI